MKRKEGCDWDIPASAATAAARSASRVGCHKGTKRPLGSVANETLRLKRMETHHVFDSFWRRKGMTRTQAYRWLAKKLDLPVKRTHIGGFEMDQCQMTIDLCNVEEEKESV